MKRPMLWLCGMAGLVALTPVSAARAQVAPAQGTSLTAAPPPVGPTLENCLVMLIDEANVPAQEAGVLSEVKVRPGTEVHAGDLLARVDDRRAQLEKQAAENEFQSAKEKASSDVNVRYAKAAADVAEAQCIANQDANRRVPNAVAMADVRKAELEHHRAVLQIEQSILDQSVAGHDAKAAAAKVEGAEDTIRRCRIVSPIDGVVVEVRRHLGEWVQGGDVVVHVERLDHLKVEGYVKESEYLGSHIKGRNVRIELQLPNGEKRELTGRVTFVSPDIQSARDYQISAEVDNRQEAGDWLLRPGKTVTMRIE